MEDPFCALLLVREDVGVETSASDGELELRDVLDALTDRRAVFEDIKELDDDPNVDECDAKVEPD